jgi:hypothetical protein
MKMPQSSVWRIGTLFAFVAISGSLSAARPDILANNGFLRQLMGPDLVSVLVVALTITFASVANVHLSISRIIASAPKPEDAKVAARPVRAQLNSNAWTIFWAFLVALIGLFVYGATKNEMAQSFAMSVCLTVVLLNGLVMHDIYRSIFILVANEEAGKGQNVEQDYTQDSPPTGD